MMIFKWSPILRTGIEMIDQQHKDIIEAADAFFIRKNSSQDIVALEECLAFLQQYILYHFQVEEAFQVQCKYPRYAAHCALHKDIATQLKFHAVKLKESHYKADEIESFNNFLFSWIEAHIFDEDMDFARHYRACNPTT